MSDTLWPARASKASSVPACGAPRFEELVLEPHPAARKISATSASDARTFSF